MKTLYTNGFLVTMDQERKIIKDGALLIESGLIKDIGTTEDLLKKYDDVERVDLKQKILLPGFIDIHTHSVLTVLKGLAEDVNTITAVYGWMAEVNKIITEEDSYFLSKLGQMEIISSGSTTIVENSTRMNGVAKAARDLGLRIVLSAGKIHDYELEPIRRGEYIYNEKIGYETMDSAMQLIKDWHGYDNGRITCNLYPHSTETCSKEILKEIQKISKDENLGVTLHMAQNTREVQRIREKYNLSPIEYMDSVGLLNDKLISAHCVFLEEKDLELMGNAGATLAHCPVIINKRSFTAPTLTAKKQKVNIGLGTDNMFADLIETMRYVLTSSRIRTGETNDFNPIEIIEMATVNGAKAIGMQDKLGSLEIGKFADFTILNNKSSNLLNYNDKNIYELIVYYCDGSDVDSVYVNGNKIFNRKEDQDKIEKIVNEGQKVSEKIWKKLDGINI